MTDQPSRIRAKAMVVLLNRDCTAQAVARLGATNENPDGFHRLIGGSIEFGEFAVEALRREIREELDTDVIEVHQLGLLENIFRFNGEPDTRSSSCSRPSPPRR